MDIQNRVLEIKNTVWYPVSIFYAHNDLGKLLSAIQTFYNKHKEWIEYFSFYISSFQGERLNMVFSSPRANKEVLYNLIDEFFACFLLSYPSEKEDNFPYEKEMWRNYDNNSIEWNRFNIPQNVLFDDTTQKISQYSALLILELYDEELDYTNNTAILLAFFMVKIYKLSLHDPLKKAVDTCIRLNDQPVAENMEILNQYWLYQPEKTAAYYYEEWSRIVETIYREKGLEKGFDFLQLVFVSLLNYNVDLLNQISNLIRKWDMPARIIFRP
jgi:hypothetical protein